MNPTRVFMRAARHIRANVVGYLALFVALGGVGYAAATIGSADVIDDSLHNRDVRDGTLQTRDLDPDTVQALRKHHHGVLLGGRTLRGVYHVEDFSGATATPGGEFAETAISYPLALPAAPERHFVPEGGAAGGSCPGTAKQPEAAPGHLCVYEENRANTDSGDITFGYGDDRDRLGFGIAAFAASNTAGLYVSTGSWAVTAPRAF